MSSPPILLLAVIFTSSKDVGLLFCRYRSDSKMCLGLIFRAVHTDSYFQRKWELRSSKFPLQMEIRQNLLLFGDCLFLLHKWISKQ